MTLEEKILRNDTRNHYTEEDIRRHLKYGVYYDISYEEFRENCLGCLIDEEDIPGMWDKLDTSVVDGVTYRYSVCL